MIWSFLYLNIFLKLINMKNIKIISIILIAIAMSCSGGYTDKNFSDALYEDTYSDEDLGYEMEVAEKLSPSASYNGVEMDSRSQEPNLIVEKKIIKDARIGLEVENYSTYRITLDSSINKVKGYVSSDNLDKNDYNINCNLVIRVPADYFDKFISSIEKGSEKLLFKNISARDVTEEVIDIEARLNTKKEVEKRYRQ